MKLSNEQLELVIQAVRDQWKAMGQYHTWIDQRTPDLPDRTLAMQNVREEEAKLAEVLLLLMEEKKGRE